MFGAPKSTPAPGPLFGSTPSFNTSTASSSSAPLSFGINLPSTTTSTTTPSASTSIPTNSLFGGQLSNNNASNSLFQNNTNTFQQPQQQQQQQPKSYLDLESCLPDTKVPHFIVTPTSVTRSAVPANFFQTTKARDELFDSFTPDAKRGLKTGESFSNSLTFNERNATLPTYLTSGDNNNSVSHFNMYTYININTYYICIYRLQVTLIHLFVI